MDSEKKCSKCGETKLLADFYENKLTAGGISYHCKDCHKASGKKYYRRTFRARQAHDKQREQTPERKAVKSLSQKNTRIRHALEIKARSAVYVALRSGCLKRQPCEICGKNKAQVHHEDYSKPLEVRWLCFEHHRRIGHGQLGHVKE